MSVQVEDGTLYCLNDNDRHILRAKTDLRLICAFTPALIGPELQIKMGRFRCSAKNSCRSHRPRVMLRVSLRRKVPDAHIAALAAEPPSPREQLQTNR